MGRSAGSVEGLKRVALAILAGLVPIWPASGEEAAPTYIEGETLPVPSGQVIRFIEMLRDTQGPSGLTLRFRFLAPGLGGEAPVSPEQAAEDMQALCDGFARARIPNLGPQPAQIVISLSARALPFGAADPTVVQYFEAYAVADGACTWDMY